MHLKSDKIEIMITHEAYEVIKFMIYLKINIKIS